MMQIREVEAALDKEWDLESGFFAKLRNLEFDEEGADRVVSILNQMPRTLDVFPRRLVAHLWYMPLTLEWNYENFAEAKEVQIDLLKYTQYKNRVITLLGEIIGGP
ncbi:MAG: hypothetical protein WC423_13655 [Vulcanimicrobiota bacterium]